MNNDKKNIIWNIIGASTNAFNSVFFTMAAAHINGEFDAGVFNFAFATACIFYVLAFYEGRVFQVTDLSGKYKDTDYIFHRITACVLMLVLSIVFVVLRNYSLEKSLILVLLCLFKCTEAVSEVFYGVVQKDGCLFKAGRSMTAKALLGLVSFVIIDYITGSLIFAILSLSAINIMLILVYDLYYYKRTKRMSGRINIASCFSLYQAGFFTFALTLLNVYLINAPRYALDFKMPDDIQLYFGIILTPATFMGLLGMYIIQPALVKIRNHIKRQEYQQLADIIRKICLLMLCLGLVVIAVAFVLEQPVLSILYGVDLSKNFAGMMIIISGSVMYGLGTILSYILIAFRKTFSQVVVYLVIAAAATAGAFLFVCNEKTAVLVSALIYLLSMTASAGSFAMLTMMTLREYKKQWKR